MVVCLYRFPRAFIIGNRLPLGTQNPLRIRLRTSIYRIYSEDYSRSKLQNLFLESSFKFVTSTRQWWSLVSKRASSVSFFTNCDTATGRNMINLLKLNKNMYLLLGQPTRKRLLPAIPYSSSKMLRRNYQTLLGIQYRQRGFLSKSTPFIRPVPFQNPTSIQSRNVGMFVGRILRSALKIRYLLLGGAVGGGVRLQKVILFFIWKFSIQFLKLSLCFPQSIDSWRDALPDTKWVQDLFPSTEQVDTVINSMMELKSKFKESLDNVEIGTIYSV